MDDINSNEGTNFMTLSFMKLLYLRLEKEIEIGNSLERSVTLNRLKKKLCTIVLQIGKILYFCRMKVQQLRITHLIIYL